MDLGFILIFALAALFFAGMSVHTYYIDRQHRPLDPEPDFVLPQLMNVHLHIAHSLKGIPPGLTAAELCHFLHESLKPYEDTPEDIERGIQDAFTAKGRKGGFVLIAESEGDIVGALVMQRTGMKGYVPENLLLFVAVAPKYRGKGLGRSLVELAIREVDGNIKLHVEHDNPARHLYEKVGFKNKYLEMRYLK